MTPRRRRLLFVVLAVTGVAAAAALALSAFRGNVLYFYSPTQIAEGQAPTGKVFRVGGMVSKGSVQRAAGSMEVRFVVTDFAKDVTVSYSGVLPDLFREGQGVIARGHLTAPGVFTAEEVLAKHDEKYMPPEVSQSLRKAYKDRQPSQTTASAVAPGGDT